MTRSTDIKSEDLQRIPGLFRRWELPDVIEARRRYHLEEAGTHADGTPLLALYTDAAPNGRSACADVSRRPRATDRKCRKS